MFKVLFTLPLLMIALSHITYASPIPGFGSSPAQQLLRNIVISELGFRIGNSQQNFWTLKIEPSSSNSNSYQFFATNPQLSARFLINIDKFAKPMTLDNYLKKWVKEYPYFGFEILQTQSFKIGGQTSYLIDLAHRKKNKQLRQFVVVKDNFAIVMTCVDEINRFKETSAQCGNLVNDFQWISKSSQ